MVALDRWLFIGSTGRVGRMLTRHWRQSPPIGARLIFQTRNMGGHNLDELEWSPMEGVDSLMQWIKRHGQISCMFMFAGVTSGPEEWFSGNPKLAEACLQAAEIADIRNVLIASTSAVYGVAGGVPLAEETPTNPASRYGRSKLEMEQISAKWRDRGIKVVSLRIGNVIGADSLFRNFSTASVEMPLLLDEFSDGGGPVRSYIGPVTMARVLEDMARKARDLPDVLNLAAPEPVSMENLAVAAQVPWRFVPAPAGAQQRITLDCRRLMGVHRFMKDASNPDAMIAEWKNLKDIE